MNTETKTLILNQIKETVTLPIDVDDIRPATFDDFQSFEDVVDDHISHTEIIYSRTAITYLLENDPSLVTSLGIANDLGFTLDSLNSEILATLHKQEEMRTYWHKVRDEVEEIFKSFNNDYGRAF